MKLDPARWFGSSRPAVRPWPSKRSSKRQSRLPRPRDDWPSKKAAWFGGIGDSARCLRLHALAHVDLSQGKPLARPGIVVRHDRIVAAKGAFPWPKKALQIKLWVHGIVRLLVFPKDRCGGAGRLGRDRALSLRLREKCLRMSKSISFAQTSYLLSEVESE